MKKTFIVLAVLAAFSATAFAGAKSYQVTGPVIAVTNDVITVQKDKEKWEINYDKAKMPAVKVGDKVMIKYEMKATGMEVKGDGKKEDKKDAKKKDDKKKK
ncbi:MAG: hypothetical protein M0024_05205 [Nitrospiraceae bacterium]|nr:hypothetical protein [Nitrospiraceae bacterium]